MILVSLANKLIANPLNAYEISMDIECEILTSQLVGINDIKAAEIEVYSAILSAFNGD